MFVNKAQALDIAITAMFREILREDEPGATVPAPGFTPVPERDNSPMPQFDFDESTCAHGGLVIERAACPIHGPTAQEDVTAEELDDITNETQDEGNPMIARARRKKEQEDRKRAQMGLYAEDIPLSGLAGPLGDGP